MDIRAYIQQLESAYRGRVFILLLIRLAWLFAALALILIVLDAGFAFAGQVRLALDGLLVVALMGCVAWSVRLAFRSRAFARMLVRLMEEGNPNLQNTLTNALDFEERMDAPDAARFSRALMKQEIDNAADQVTSIENYDALTPPTMKREGWTLGALLVLLIAGGLFFPAVYLSVIPRYLLPFGDYPPYSSIHFAVEPGNTTVDYGSDLKIEVTASNHIPEQMELVLLDSSGAERAAIEMHHEGEGAFFQSLEKLQESVTYFARAEGGRSWKYSIRLNTTPRIEDIVVEYTYPEYTFRDPETTVLTEYALKGYASTQVTMRVRSNRPLRGGAVTVNGESIPFRPLSEQEVVEAVFPISESGSFSASIEDIDGNASVDEIKGNIEIIPDEKPEVVIASPGMDSFAVPDSKVPILVDASDDLGITKIAFFRRHNESSDSRKHLYEEAGHASFVTADDTLDLKDLGVRPGDSIDYYATATDSNPDQPQTATSQMYRLQIISHEEYREFAQSQMTAEDLRQKYEGIQEEMEALADTQRELQAEIDSLREKLANEGELSPEDRDRLAAAEMEQAALAEEAEALAERLKEMADQPAVFDIENEYKEALRDFAERLAEANKQMEEARKQMAAAGQEQAPEDPAQQPDQNDPSGQPDSPSPAMQQLQQASEAQQKALEELAQNMEEFQEGIQKANENLERVANVMGDVEQFKYLYELQKSLERTIGYYKEMENISAEDRARLVELSEQQAEVLSALATLKESLRAHADDLEALAREEEEFGDGLPQE